MIFTLKCFLSPSSSSSVGAAPFLSSLPPCIIPLIMCQCNFGVQDVSSLKRMCFFFFPVPYLRAALLPSLSQPHILQQLSSFLLNLSPLPHCTLAANPPRSPQLVFSALPRRCPQSYVLTPWPLDRSAASCPMPARFAPLHQLNSLYRPPISLVTPTVRL